jgi:hypothetical protein
MNPPGISAVIDCQSQLTREECACIFEREFELVAEDIHEHPEGQNFIERLVARLPSECIALLIEGGLFQKDFDS